METVKNQTDLHQHDSRKHFRRGEREGAEASGVLGDCVV